MILHFILFLFWTPLNGFPLPNSSPEVASNEQVGMGFGLNPFGTPRSSLMRQAAQAQALALKAHADFYRYLAAAKFKHDMALAKARAAPFSLPFKTSLLGSEPMKKPDLDELNILDNFEGLDFSQLEGMNFNPDDFDLGFDYKKRSNDDFGNGGYDESISKSRFPDFDEIYEESARKKYRLEEEAEESSPRSRNSGIKTKPLKPIIVNPQYGLNNPRFINFDPKNSRYINEDDDDSTVSLKNQNGDNKRLRKYDEDDAKYLPAKLPKYLVNKREVIDDFNNEEPRKSNHHHHNSNRHRDEELYVWSLNWQNNFERANDQPKTQDIYFDNKNEENAHFTRYPEGPNNFELNKNGIMRNAPNFGKPQIKRSIDRPLSFDLFRNNPAPNEDTVETKTTPQNLPKTYENKLQSCDNELGCYLIEISGPPEFWDTHIINDNVKLEGFEKVNPKNYNNQNFVPPPIKPVKAKNDNSTKLREAKTNPRHFHHFHHKFNNENRNHFWGLRPTQVTINNQQNSFSNTNAGGNIQIAQTNGNSATSQAASRNSEILKSPQLLQFPFNRRAYKRSLPLIKLIADPNAKLDMPKTIENVGTIARNSFGDKRAPMYHLKNMVGSMKNAFLSTLKIAPQDLVIPSQYKIIDKKHEDLTRVVDSPAPILQSTNNIKEIINKPLTLREKLEKFRLERERRLNMPKINEGLLKQAAFNKQRNNLPEEIVGNSIDNKEDPFNFLGTFQKLGTIIRDSVNSGKDTLNHVTDAAQSARKVFHTARFAAPRVLLPYRKAAVLQKPEKVMMITPRFLDVAKDDHENEEFKDFVGVNHIMDAFGISNPTNREVNYMKTTIQRGSGPKLMSRFGDEGDDENDNKEKLYIVSENLDQNDLDEEFIDDAWSSLQKIKEIIGVNTIGEFLDTMEKEFSSIRDKHETPTKVPNLTSRFAEDNNDELNEFLTDLFAENNNDQEEVVGIGLNLPPNLLKPFMNQPSNDELSEYLKENGDSVEEEDLFKKDDDLLLSPANASIVDNDANSEKGDEDLRTSMHFHKSLLKPFLGKVDVSEEDDYYPYGNYMIPYDEK